MFILQWCTCLHWERILSNGCFFDEDQIQVILFFSVEGGDTSFMFKKLSFKNFSKNSKQALQKVSAIVDILQSHHRL